MTRQETAGALADSVEVRERLVEALNLDLIGPWGGHALAAERLPGWVRPSNWYLTGFLIPSGTKPELSADADEQDDIDETPESSGLAEESSEERKAAKNCDRALGGFFPSSMGLSFLVAADADALAVIVRWGDYEPARVEGADGKSDSAWVRESNERTVPVALSGAGAHRRGDHAVPDSAGLTLHVDERPIRTDALAEIPAGTRSVSVFLVNGRAPDDDNPDRNYAFQAEIEVRGRQPFVPRPDPRGVQAVGWDDRVADLPLRGYPRVRHRPRGIRGLGGRGGSLPDAAYGVDPKGLTSRRRRPRACPAPCCRWTRSGRCLTRRPPDVALRPLGGGSIASGSNCGARKSKRCRMRVVRPPGNCCVWPASPRTAWNAASPCWRRTRTCSTPSA